MVAVLSKVQLVGRSPWVVDLDRRVAGIARVRRTTLICGPTGSGKEVVARSLHARSCDPDRPFVAVHCAALPENLVEAELFGHARGAFTGAERARDGLIRSAGNGTLFLDEVDSLSLPAQAKLLRYLEVGEYRAVGSDRVEHSDAWVVAATNQDLGARVSAGAFREDLMFRLQVVRLDLPPLRERGEEDILVLAEHFLAELACGKRFSETARAALRRHAWPGNVRELKHRVESAALLDEEELIEPAALGLTGPRPAERPSAQTGDGLEERLWQLVRDRGLTLLQATDLCERVIVQAALRAEGNNRTRAASRLGINVRTIYKKLTP
jgi:DNA-binding NtrC family response regulator